MIFVRKYDASFIIFRATMVWDFSLMCHVKDLCP